MKKLAVSCLFGTALGLLGLPSGALPYGDAVVLTSSVVWVADTEQASGCTTDGRLMPGLGPVDPDRQAGWYELQGRIAVPLKGHGRVRVCGPITGSPHSVISCAELAGRGAGQVTWVNPKTAAPSVVERVEWTLDHGWLVHFTGGVNGSWTAGVLVVREAACVVENGAPVGEGRLTGGGLHLPWWPEPRAPEEETHWLESARDGDKAGSR